MVDVDLEKFFDRVNHDVLMGKLENRIDDLRMLTTHPSLPGSRHHGGRRGDGAARGDAARRAALAAIGERAAWTKWIRSWNDADTAFVRYADDCNVYVQSKRAGERVLAVLRQWYAKLRLRINEEKSAVAPAWNRTFLGYSFWVAAGGTVKRRVAAKALEEMKQRVREITRRSGGRSLDQVAKQLGGYLRGWKEYFRLAETPRILRDLDAWIHRRLRAVALKQWKRGRATLSRATRSGRA